MKFAAALLLAASAAHAQSFPPINRSGAADFTLKLISGKCMPESLSQELSEIGAYVDRSKRDGRLCCPFGITHASPRTIDQSIWRKVQPFAASRGNTGLDQDALCNATPMTDEEFARLGARVEADRQVALRKQAEDEKRPYPPTWSALKSSSHSADAALVKSVERLEWWDACVAWGREARAKTLSRRGHALQLLLVHRGNLNTLDLRNSKERVPSPGQTSCGTFAILGLPEKANTTESLSSVRNQYVYRSRGIYVYTSGPAGDHNGVVSSIQR